MGSIDFKQLICLILAGQSKTAEFTENRQSSAHHLVRLICLGMNACHILSASEADQGTVCVQAILLSLPAFTPTEYSGCCTEDVQT